MLSIILISICIQLVWTSPIGKEHGNPTLLISLDGLRADKLDIFLAQHKNSYIGRFLVDRGIKAEYMKPAFPSLTFPNHFTLVTGLYPESHGIVGNTIFDPDLNIRINLLNDNDSNNPRWWNQAEPFWLTSKKQGLKTASFFWTGSEVWTRHPDVFFQYLTTRNYLERCEEVVGWFKKFEMDFVSLYFNEPDSTGHDFGVDSMEYMQKIYEVDETLGYLFTLMVKENLLDKVNIILVSDHGMVDMKQTILVNTLIQTAWVNTTRTVWGIVASVWPISEDRKEDVYNGLKQSPNLQVYYKEDVPERFHYNKNNRIGPIVTIADEGYVLNTATQTNVANHAFDNELVSMRAVFLASGPDFRRNVKIGPVNNVNVYPLLCELLNVRCNPNNGTIRSFLDAINFTPKNLY